MLTTPSNLEIKDLSFAYAPTEPTGKPLFRGFKALLKPGVNLVSGDEGTGKTTLLKILSGALVMDSGSLKLNQIQMDNEHVSWQAQVFYVEPRSEAFDQVKVTDYFHSLSDSYPGFDSTLAIELAQELGLEPHLHKPLYMLSTGSKRKLWICAAFCAKAPLTLIDDPFAALDSSSVNVVLELFEEVAEQMRDIWVITGYEAHPRLKLSSHVQLTT